MKRLDSLSFLIVVFLLVINGLVWFQIVFNDSVTRTSFYFLDVGQGDGTLGVFEGGAKFLVDAGPGAKTVSALQEVLGTNDKYIDLVFITHPQLDHFGGLNFVLDRYELGAVVINGREVDLPEWTELLEELEGREIPILTLGAEDRISYRDHLVDFLSPDGAQIQSAELNDGSLVSLITTPEAKVLLTGDISANIEKYLLEKFEGGELAADILKVPHHGSKYSSSEDFIRAVRPKIAIIEVGKNNYGHPTEEVLRRLQANNVKVFRTDVLGNIKTEFSLDRISVFTP